MSSWGNEGGPRVEETGRLEVEEQRRPVLLFLGSAQGGSAERQAPVLTASLPKKPSYCLHKPHRVSCVIV